MLVLDFSEFVAEAATYSIGMQTVEPPLFRIIQALTWLAHSFENTQEIEITPDQFGKELKSL